MDKNRDDDWMDRAACRSPDADPDAFFHHDQVRLGVNRERDRVTIREWCTGCEVRLECLRYALAYDVRYGIWGGFSAADRDTMVGNRPSAIPGNRHMRKVRGRATG